MSKNKLFRKAALERLSSPEQLDQMMQVLTPKSWLFLWGMLFLLTVITLWGVFGRISMTIEGQGILAKQGGIQDISSGKSGRIEKIYVESGDIVEKEQVIASVIIEIDQSSENAQQSFPGRLSSQTSSSLRGTKRVVSDIISPFTGRVLEVKILAGSNVEPTTTLMNVETLEQNLQAIFYVPPQDGKKVRIGSLVQVAPTTVRKEQFGFIEAKVHTVSEFPVTRESMIRLLKNEQLVATFSQGGAPIEVIANLDTAAYTVSGYKWSSGVGPAQQVHSGTLCATEVVYERQRPITLLFLWLREVFSGSEDPFQAKGKK